MSKSQKIKFSCRPTLRSIFEYCRYQ